jgi:hypothetical protein
LSICKADLPLLTLAAAYWSIIFKMKALEYEKKGRQFYRLAAEHKAAVETELSGRIFLGVSIK